MTALPVGLEESLRLVDQDLAATEASLQGLFDLLSEDGTAPETVAIFVRRKRGLVGHLREDLQKLPDRFEAKA